jgi:tetratricopeptide (TPR) repeat protein
MNSVVSSGVLGFDYDEALTLTASEAFERRTGNCIGFANMMIALARRAGLQASYQEVIRRPEWSSREDTILLIKHINVIVESPRYTYVLDVSGVKINPNMRRRVIGDNYAKALYLNNIGAVALLENDLPTAHAYLSSAIKVEPLITDPWVNMGVVFGRNEQLPDAVIAYNRALDIDASERAAMSNLYEVYLEQQDLESAENLQAKVEKYRRNNPYYLLKLSDEALEQARFEESLSLLKKAIRKKKNDHQLHFALAKTQYLSGEIAAAEGSLVRARELAPENMLGYYGQSLDQLVADE